MIVSKWKKSLPSYFLKDDRKGRSYCILILLWNLRMKRIYSICISNIKCNSVVIPMENCTLFETSLAHGLWGYELCFTSLVSGIVCRVFMLQNATVVNSECWFYFRINGGTLVSIMHFCYIVSYVIAHRHGMRNYRRIQMMCMCCLQFSYFIIFQSIP